MICPTLFFFNYLCLLRVQDPCCGLLHVINFKILSCSHVAPYLWFTRFLRSVPGVTQPVHFCIVFSVTVVLLKCVSVFLNSAQLQIGNAWVMSVWEQSTSLWCQHAFWMSVYWLHQCIRAVFCFSKVALQGTIIFTCIYMYLVNH